MKPAALDALLYAYVISTVAVEDDERHTDLLVQLDAIVEPFVGPDWNVFTLRYSDDSPVTVLSDPAAGQSLQTVRTPPGYPAAVAR